MSSKICHPKTPAAVLSIHTYIYIKRKGTRVNKNWHYTNASRRTKCRQPPIQYAKKIKLHEKKVSHNHLCRLFLLPALQIKKSTYTHLKKNSCVVKSPVQPHKEQNKNKARLKNRCLFTHFTSIKILQLAKLAKSTNGILSTTQRSKWMF